MLIASWWRSVIAGFVNVHSDLCPETLPLGWKKGAQWPDDNGIAICTAENNIPSDGIVAIAAALQQNTTLRSLTICSVPRRVVF